MNLPLSSKPSHRRSVTERSAQNGPFARLHLSKNVCTALQKVMGFRLPTPIQRCAIPPILEGKDVVAMARTGSGKTVAFLAPLMDLLIDHSSAVGIRAIIVSPTRELAVQTASVTKKLMKLTNLKLAVLMGGAAMQGQFERLSLNPDIVLATPGRLIHHLVEAELSLKAVQIVIVDEADRLFELGFSEQLQTLWAALPPTRQCVLISATLPAKLVSFSRIGLKEPVFVRLDIEQSLSPTLDLQFLYIRETDKVAALFRVAKKTMQEERKALVFVATRHHVEFCSRALQRLGGRVSLVYGKMDQECRLQQLSTYRKGESDFLVVTDVAARGLDMPLVDTIINYDFPSSSKLFIHRAGRTARNGKSGTAISFVTQADLPYTVELLLFLDRKLVLSTDTQISIVADDEIVNADSSETKDIPSSTLSSISTPSSTFAQIGALPELHVEIEYFYKLLEQDCEFESLYKSMLAAYKLYYKTRLPASSRSKDRAKVLLDSCGGASRLSEMVHPAFKMQGYNLHETVMGDDTSLNLIDEMRSFRPSVGRKNGALSTSVASQMARQKFLSKETTRPMHFSITPNGPDSTTLEPRIDFFSNGLPDSLYPENSFKVSSHEDLLSEAKGIEGTHTTFVRNEKSSETPSEGFCKTGASSSSDSPPVVLASGKLEFQSASAVTYHPSSLKVRQRGPRISKRRQRRQGEGATTLSSHCIATSTASNPQFFLNARISEKGLLRDDVLSIQNAQMDVTPDEESDLKRSKHVQKWNWNPKKKKYEKGILDASGKIMKDHKGKKIRGQVEKKGIYKKWMATSKRRIQRVGEKEDTTNIPRAAKRRNCTTENEQQESDENAVQQIRLQNDKQKEFIKNHQNGLPLTNKEQRMLKKLSLTPKPTRTNAVPLRSELKTPGQIAKDRRKQTNSAGNSTKATRINRHTQKKKWEAKHDKKIAQRGRPNRSKLIRRSPKNKARL
ncbi:DEAD/DEAH box helicase domain-containing protein [Cardiosporidium cionae]|uniref:RNA helicase n=1 Tax=Cardiosporidium cionae TaxID=476202 RepID=A0ABQ7JAR4_9APIC|nr:DEAD/DEAH box helicase domain-containing protein [Cardiosporidium cionae]|eukprot:KAF8821059.1 DEAD/DEAH box helicase domain-containing protein [Cardiosporidium cionae]